MKSAGKSAVLDRIDASRPDPWDANRPIASLYRGDRSLAIPYMDGDTAGNGHSFRNFTAGLDGLDVAPRSRATGFVLDAILIVSGWFLFIGLIAYPQAQLAGILGCAIALLASRKQRSAKRDTRAWH
jgi:hypothetical protein